MTVKCNGCSLNCREWNKTCKKWNKIRLVLTRQIMFKCLVFTVEIYWHLVRIITMVPTESDLFKICSRFRDQSPDDVSNTTKKVRISSNWGLRASLGLNIWKTCLIPRSRLLHHSIISWVSLGISLKATRVDPLAVFRNWILWHWAMVTNNALTCSQAKRKLKRITSTSAAAHAQASKTQHNNVKQSQVVKPQTFKFLHRSQTHFSHQTSLSIHLSAPKCRGHSSSPCNNKGKESQTSSIIYRICSTHHART
jgi:hypothetical protein